MTQIAEGMNAVPRHTAGQRMATVGLGIGEAQPNKISSKWFTYVRYYWSGLAFSRRSTFGFPSLNPEFPDPAELLRAETRCPGKPSTPT
jgi:hypothetical protein